MINNELICRMKDYAMKIMSKEIGYKRTLEWLNNYKFPETNKELIKLSNVWHGTVWNILIDIDKPTKEELEKEELERTIPIILRNEIFNKYYKKIGPSNVYRWLDNYKFPNTYEELIKVKNNWNNIIKELDSININKKDLYKDISEYYKDLSKFQYYKYKLLGFLCK